jgi:two-component system phosphate regulon response regulator PhoB
MSATAFAASGPLQQTSAMSSDESGANPDALLKVGAIELDRPARRVRRNGHPIHVGPTEFRLLEFLMRSPGRVFSRAELRAAMWGNADRVDGRTVDVHVGRLRRALGSRAPIRTVRGFGYSLDEHLVDGAAN